jgi:FlaA1/EpsC-like NDP-sugar epimerase
VTGGAGSIGSELVMQLAGLGAKHIVVFDIAESPLHDLEVNLLAHFPTLDFHSIVGDITQEEDIR